MRLTLAAQLSWLLLTACDAANPLGAACDADADCASGLCITSGDFPGGLCTEACGEEGPCPAGFSCVSNASGICLPSCETDADCARPGYICSEQSVETSSGGSEGKVRVCAKD
jgi:hypothetical protein